MYINRMELMADIQKSTYKFPNGNFGHLELQHYRGFPVGVRQYETNVINEARTVLSLPSHPVFPVLIGVCCDMKPYLLVTMVYGNVHNGVYMSVCGLIVHCRQNDIDILQWVSILLEIAEGLSLMHSCGFVHGNLTVENIILRKEKGRSHTFSPVFLNLEKAKALERSCHDIEYQQDFEMFSFIIDKIIDVYNLKDVSNLTGLNTTLQLVKKVPVNGSLSEVVIYLKKMLSK